MNGAYCAAVDVLQTLVIARGAGLGIWGVINLLEGWGNDSPIVNKKYQKQSAGPGLQIAGRVP